MQLTNPIQMNDWGIKDFLKLVLAIQFTMWGVIGLDLINIQIPIIRQFIGFIYITFSPGILLLRILKLHKLGNIRTLLYSIGLSISALMFTGLLMNTAFPFFGIERTISLFPLMIIISAVILVLCVLSYLSDNEYANPALIDLSEVLSAPVLFLCSIPFAAIFGTYLINFYDNNIFLMFMIVEIAVVALLIAFDKFIPKNLYPLAVITVAISLLYHTSLISMYVWGYDIHSEIYYSEIVMRDFQWDATIPSNINAMLSTVILAPIYSNICSMSLTWVFKIIYPLLFALVPLCLYRIFQIQTNDKIAFLSCVFFMSIFTFYTETLALARQQIAELFLTLLVLLMVDKNIDKTKRSFMLIAFGISLAVSHYGLNYIYMFCLFSAWLMLALGENQLIQKIMKKFYSTFGGKIYNSFEHPISLNIDGTISSTFVLIVITFSIAWYMYVSNSSALNEIVNIGNKIATSIFAEFLNPQAVQGLDIIFSQTASPLHNAAKYLHLISQFFIVIGVVTLVMKNNKMKFEREYEAFVLLNLAICFAAIALPHFASSLRTTRLYAMTLIILSPFFVIGWIKIFTKLVGFGGNSRMELREKNSLKVLSAFLVIFLLFNSGWIYEIAKDHPNSIALSKKSISECSDINTIVSFYTTVTPEQEVFSAIWISNKRDYKEKIYATYNDFRVHALTSYGIVPISETPILTNTTNDIDEESYIYLQRLNVIEGVGTDWYQGTIYSMNEIYHLFEGKRKIYSNGASVIYK
ncbi:MAG: hypothetical protein A4E48_00010 [Methanosaeta sp. PtaU1.Bin060]|nr:MAG: hypothetical protein A4E48_00010 [Methanosaeta sp. PtaU1.Bin060]